MKMTGIAGIGAMLPKSECDAPRMEAAWKRGEILANQHFRVSRVVNMPLGARMINCTIEGIRGQGGVRMQVGGLHVHG